AGRKGLILFLYDAGNSDRLTLATVSQAGTLAAVANLGLGSNIKECHWYRLAVEVIANPVLPNVKVTGKGFKHAGPNNPSSATDLLPIGTLTFNGNLTTLGLTSPGEVGIAASAASTNVDSSLTNFTVGP